MGLFVMRLIIGINVVKDVVGLVMAQIFGGHSIAEISHPGLDRSRFCCQ